MTPILERLVMTGKASFHTFVAGGAEKCILNVDNGEFIIITSITYASVAKNNGIRINNAGLNGLMDRLFTQVRIFSTKSNNTFLFRDSFTLEMAPSPPAGDYFIIPQGTVQHETFLIHESDVSFTFSSGGATSDFIRVVAPANQIAYAPPHDYGNVSQPGSIPTRQVGNIVNSPGVFFVPGGQNALPGVPAGSGGATQFIFPVNFANNMQAFVNNSFSTPLLNVGYYKINGVLTDIQASI